MFTAKCPKCRSRISLEDHERDQPQLCPSCGSSFNPSDPSGGAGLDAAQPEGGPAIPDSLRTATASRQPAPQPAQPPQQQAFQQPPPQPAQRPQQQFPQPGRPQQQAPRQPMPQPGQPPQPSFQGTVPPPGQQPPQPSQQQPFQQPAQPQQQWPGGTDQHQQAPDGFSPPGAFRETPAPGAVVGPDPARGDDVVSGLSLDGRVDVNRLSGFNGAGAAVPAAPPAGIPAPGDGFFPQTAPAGDAFADFGEERDPAEAEKQRELVLAMHQRKKRKRKIILWAAIIGILANVVLGFLIWPNREPIKKWIVDNIITTSQE